MSNLSTPVELEFLPSTSSKEVENIPLKTFSSYSFDRSLLTPASAFRFTAPGIDKDTRLAIRSGDFVAAHIVNKFGEKKPIAVGFVDETDTHVVPQNVEYVITGRDVLGQLVDNAAVDKYNRIINTSQVSLGKILSILLQNTRIPKGFVSQQVPNGTLLFQTSPEETKINCLQRYLEFTNCLVWAQPNGQLVLGKPNFTQNVSGSIVLNSSNPTGNNCLEMRVRRNLNQTIQTIVAQLQSMDQVDAGSFTKYNNDKDMLAVQKGGVGKSVYRRFSYGSGNDAVNTVTQIGNQSGNPRKIGDEYALREVARENMKVLDVEVVLVGHENPIGEPYNIDQMYNVQCEDENLDEDLYAYHVSYELTIEHGMLTRMRLCRKGTICAYADAIARTR